MLIVAYFPLRFRGRMEDSGSYSAYPADCYTLEDRIDAKLAVTLIDIGVRKLVPASEIIFVVPTPFLDIPQIVYEITLPWEKLGLGSQIIPV